ncbi:uncharacterized protein BJ171DRAFT_35436 [Polychytrium aggregatum]|uniref:uncharacterized protein n=1 Tax=Polychytrium aggregatum TaxID=110093 RepID=UPI0022FE7866|nr:uncharacterized protein BJ171DRAFT_35436 [Polychytrium aggregatum]KAI9192937.1 hypothetical protein BJ171DRAFT_35436 [Polychytrium aggregatum]
MTELISSVVINATEVRESPSRHVVYQLSIRTPSRSWTVWRRYSEFETLHSLLRELSPTPFGLPPKSFSIWGNTLSDPSKVEARRLGLETYVQTILNHENDLWKTSKAWFDFIALPESSRRLSILGRTPSNGGGNPTDPAGVVASAPVDRPLYTTESWMDELRDMQQFCKEIRTKIAARDRFAQAGDTASMQYASMQGKKGLGVVSTRISDLEYALAQHKPAPGQGRPSSVSSGEPAALQRLPSATRSTVLTAGEYSRRQDLLDSLKEERDVLSKLLSSNPSVYRQPRVDSAERNALLGFGSIGAGGYSSSVSTSPNESFGTVPTGSSAASSTARPNNTTPPRSTRRFGQPKETEQTRALDQQGLLQLQKQTMNQQDQSVDMLSSILQRQKQIGLAISDELDTQNSLLEDLDENVDRVGRNLKKADKRLANVRKG